MACNYSWWHHPQNHINKVIQISSPRTQYTSARIRIRTHMQGWFKYLWIHGLTHSIDMFNWSETTYVVYIFLMCGFIVTVKIVGLRDLCYLSFMFQPGTLGANTRAAPTNSAPQHRAWVGQNQPSYVKADVLINQRTHCTSPNVQAITLAPTRKHVCLPSSNAHSRKQNPSQLPWGWSLLLRVLSKHSQKYLLKWEE